MTENIMNKKIFIDLEKTTKRMKKYNNRIIEYSARKNNRPPTLNRVEEIEEKWTPIGISNRAFVSEDLFNNVKKPNTGKTKFVVSNKHKGFDYFAE